MHYNVHTHEGKERKRIYPRGVNFSGKIIHGYFGPEAPPCILPKMRQKGMCTEEKSSVWGEKNVIHNSFIACSVLTTWVALYMHKLHVSCPTGWTSKQDTSYLWLSGDLNRGSSVLRPTPPWLGYCFFSLTSHKLLYQPWPSTSSALACKVVVALALFAVDTPE